MYLLQVEANLMASLKTVGNWAVCHQEVVIDAELSEVKLNISIVRLHYLTRHWVLLIAGRVESEDEGFANADL